MSMHLIKFGFTPSYRIWTYHGEKAKKRARKEVRQIQPRGEYDTGFDRCLENLANGNVPESPHVEVETPQDAETSEDPEENTKEYYEALFASQKPLHENTEVTQLDAIARLMALKCHRNLCRDGFDELLVIVGSLLPKGHLLPQNFYYSTKLLSDLKMSSQQIHACPKGCMLFREEHADTNYCIKCNSSRYFEVDRNGDGQKRQTTVAKNILRYLPVLPRIQRLFMTEDTAQQMRWAVEGNRYTDKMIHPSDGTAWKNFVKKFPLKAGDPRSVAVAISTDGFNPYGMSAAVYSCWPVFVIPMNLPPGVCMRSENMFVSMIIPGPKYPGKNMNVYLEPLVDDLVRGWEGRGIRTYDASKKEYFDMYVWYHTSLHDLPARALFCGWCTHGKWPCPQCRQAVTFFWLNKGGKYSCFDEARQFLERRHAYRSDVKSFKKGRELRTGAKPNVFAVLKKMKQRKTPDPETGSAVWLNPQCETQCTSYVSKFKQKYGEEANPEAEDFDPEVAVLAGEGLKHGRLWFGDGCVDPAKVPSLRQIRRGRKSGQPEVEPRPRASDLAVERLREEMAAKEQAAQEQRAHMEQQILEYQQQQIQMMQQMQQQQQMMQAQQAQMSWLMSQTVLSSPPGSIAAPPPYTTPWMPPPPTQTPGTPVTVNNLNIIRSMNRDYVSQGNDDEAGGSGGGQG
ncbi:hypothetical protein QYE76_039781 [Lolium multiflorum]|uniref:Transposase n=1 Tax=Lolium multiflorum TaxID=4521 RepID=A0AAD8WUU1_LOLMU|nr:hypothetical protein QYE76_039781 [Lolium multiflorum]